MEPAQGLATRPRRDRARRPRGGRLEDGDEPAGRHRAARRDHLGLARAAPVRGGAGQRMAALAGACDVSGHRGAVLVGAHRPARPGARLWGVARLPVRDLAAHQPAGHAADAVAAAVVCPGRRRRRVGPHRARRPAACRSHHVDSRRGSLYACGAGAGGRVDHRQRRQPVRQHVAPPASSLARTRVSRADRWAPRL
jgi:hypothetical protein